MELVEKLKNIKELSFRATLIRAPNGQLRRISRFFQVKALTAATLTFGVRIVEVE
ncbi:MAG: hypothetical protein ACI90U_001651 [Pseudomonadales bacterium]|jgi:hypothetical protein